MFDELTERLRAGLEKPTVGQIRVYRLCADCFSVSFGMGQIERALTDPAIIIA